MVVCGGAVGAIRGAIGTGMGGCWAGGSLSGCGVVWRDGCVGDLSGVV